MAPILEWMEVSKTMKERVRDALEKMPEDLPLTDFLDGINKLVQVQQSLEEVEQGKTISNDELWKTRPWRR